MTIKKCKDNKIEIKGFDDLDDVIIIRQPYIFDTINLFYVKKKTTWLHKHVYYKITAIKTSVFCMSYIFDKQFTIRNQLDFNKRFKIPIERGDL